MGGNATFIKSDGTSVEAEKIDLLKTGRAQFIKKFVSLFKELNKQFYKKHKTKLWMNEDNLVTGKMFNGSTSFIFDSSIPDDDLLKYKKSSGDLDVIVPEHLKQELFQFLKPLQGKEIVKDIVFTGITNAKNFGETIICIFTATFGDYKVNAQVDFECLPVDSQGTPSTWARFSHSSSFDDAKVGLKGVGHKYLITAIVGSASIRDDIVIVTNKSTTEKYTLKKMHSLPRMLKFSVDKGIRVAYELMKNKDGTPFKIDGKDVYRELKTNESDFVTIIGEMYKLVFKRLDDSPEDVKKFWSMKGVVDLMNKYMDSKYVQGTVDRMIEMLWGDGSNKGTRSGQPLEERNKQWDYEVKMGIYSYLKDNLKGYKHSSKVDKQIEVYYSKFKEKKPVSESVSFKDFLFNTGFNEK